MVKVFFLFFFSFTFILNAEISVVEGVTSDDVLTEKIKSFLDKETYKNNSQFIDVIFDPKSNFYVNDRVDSVKVIETLKENGLLKLFFKKPMEFKLNFKTSGYPLFFVKIMGDTLRKIGYYRYVTTASNLDVSEFTWNIVLNSEYATDPLVLQRILNKSGCSIVDVERNSAQEWTYIIDISRGYLNIEQLEDMQDISLKRSLYAYWLDVSKIRLLTIKSSRRNRWYPEILFYDTSLHLLKVIKEDQVRRRITLHIPQNAKYMKISDLYTLKNVKDELRLYPSGSK